MNYMTIYCLLLKHFWMTILFTHIILLCGLSMWLHSHFTHFFLVLHTCSVLFFFCDQVYLDYVFIIWQLKSNKMTKYTPFLSAVVSLIETVHLITWKSNLGKQTNFIYQVRNIPQPLFLVTWNAFVTLGLSKSQKSAETTNSSNKKILVTSKTSYTITSVNGINI